MSKNYNVLAISIFFILLLALFKSYLLNLNNHILFNNRDPALNLYFLKWVANYMLGSLSGSSIFNLPVAFPFQHSLAFSDNLFGNQIIFSPYYVITENPLIAFNLWIITTYFLNYYLMFLYLKNSKFVNVPKYSPIPIMGAVIFTFSIPSFDLLGGHLQLSPLYFIPITLFILERLMTSLKRRYFVLFGLSISFQFYLGIQTGFILLVLLMLLMPVYSISLLENKLLFIKRAWLSIATFILPTVFLLLPYYDVSKLTGHRIYGEVLLYIPSFDNLFSTGIGEKAIFIGLPILLLCILAIYFIRSKKSRILIGLVVLSYLFFLKETHIFELFFTCIPGFDSIRTPGRFILVTVTIISIFISVTFSNIEVKKVKYIFFMFLLAMFISLHHNGIASEQYKHKDYSISTQALGLINHEPTLMLPLYKFKVPDLFDIVQRMKNVDMQFPILDIYSGFNPTFISEIENQYTHKQNNINDGKNLIYRIYKLGFRHIIIEKNKGVNVNTLSALDEDGKYKKEYEDDKLILYSLIQNIEKNISLNETLEKTSWFFKVEGFKSVKNKTIFTGYLIGEELFGVVQKNEEVSISVAINHKEYPCDLQLDKIKDTFSIFKCISREKIPELLPMNRVLNSPKVEYQVIEPYNSETNAIKLKVTNTGNETWLAGFYGKYGLALSYMVENKRVGLPPGYNNRF